MNELLEPNETAERAALELEVAGEAVDAISTIPEGDVPSVKVLPHWLSKVESAADVILGRPLFMTLYASFMQLEQVTFCGRLLRELLPPTIPDTNDVIFEIVRVPTASCKLVSNSVRHMVLLSVESCRHNACLMVGYPSCIAGTIADAELVCRPTDAKSLEQPCVTLLTMVASVLLLHGACEQRPDIHVLTGPTTEVLELKTKLTRACGFKHCASGDATMVARVDWQEDDNDCADTTPAPTRTAVKAEVALNFMTERGKNVRKNWEC